MPQERSGTFFVKGEKIVLKKDGTWVADGIEITHEQTCALFYKAIHWDPTEKKFCLKVGYETIFIEVEDTPHFVSSLELGAKPRATLASAATIALQAARLKYEYGNLYLRLDDGLRAKFLSAPYYDLMSLLEEDDEFYFLTISAERVNLAPKARAGGAFRPGAPKRP
ncbi:MAG: DUF1285 domain-containing protein [Deltaproteobacteria bacterium]|nr:DUF1285 domain-containing protein [Deltaproteobacteria bacterium]